MRGFYKWLICGFFLVTQPGLAWSAGQPLLGPTTAVLTTALPDSVRLRMLALLAEGDIAGAIALWQVRTGQTDVLKVLQDLQVAFHVAVRHGGKIFDAFTGPGGMLEKDYLRNIIMAGEPIIHTVASP